MDKVRMGTYQAMLCLIFVILYCQLKGLESSVNPEASKQIQYIEQGRELQFDQAHFVLFSTSLSEVETTSFNDAWNHPYPTNRELWRIAIKEELGEMKNKKGWESMNKEDVPKGRRTIKCKWILRINRNGECQARLVTCSYSQIPGSI